MREIGKRTFPLAVFSFLVLGCGSAFANEAMVEAEMAFLHARELDAQKQFSEALVYYEKACALADNYKNCDAEIEETKLLLANERKREEKPEDVKVLKALALNYKMKRHLQEFFALILEAYTIKPTAESAANLAVAYYEVGNLEKSLEYAKIASDLGWDNYYTKIVYIAILIETGEQEKGKALLRALRDEKIDEQKQWYNVACAYAALADDVNAVKYLRKAIDDHEKNRITACYDRSYNPIRESPLFQELVYAPGEPLSGDNQGENLRE
ncbi:TPR end-of-group domain-containing protein [Thiovibrio sp. JS02]